MSPLKTKREIPLTKVFERIFNLSSHASRVLLIDFLNTVLEGSLSSPIAEIIHTLSEAENRERMPHHCLQLKMKTLSDQVLNIQLQLHPEAFYRSQIREHTYDMTKADADNRYLIHLLNFNLLQEFTHYHNQYPVNTSNVRSFREVHYLELSKFNLDLPTTQLEEWLYFIIYVGRKDKPKRFQELIHDNPYFKLAELLYRRRAPVENYPVIVKEEQLNLTKWVEERRFVEKERIAIKMIKAGFKYQQIVELTNIKLEDLDYLALTTPLLPVKEK